MDTTLLENPAFWTDPSPVAAGEFPGDLDAFPELAGHVLFQTSGTSGNPKWVAISKQALLISAAAVNQHLNVLPDSVWGLALPLHHVGGFGVVARAFEAACALQVFPQRWDAQAFQRWSNNNKITHTSLVPTQVHDLVRTKQVAPPTLEAVVVGGGSLDMTTGQAARNLGWPVLASFGMTETASQVATQSLDSLLHPYQPAPIPLLPIWKARDAGDHALALSGPALFSGYLSDRGFAARGDEWHLTSDRAALHHNQLTPLGRKDFQVKILGELVDPEAIEHDLIAQSGGRLSSTHFAIIAIPDERAGYLLVPMVEAGIDRLFFESILSAYAEQAPGFRRLQSIAEVEKFPRSPLGKIHRAELTTIYQQRLLD